MATGIRATFWRQEAKQGEPDSGARPPAGPPGPIPRRRFAHLAPPLTHPPHPTMKKARAKTALSGGGAPARAAADTVTLPDGTTVRAHGWKGYIPCTGVVKGPG